VRQHLLRGERLPSLRSAAGLPHRLPRRVRVHRRMTAPMTHSLVFDRPLTWLNAGYLARVVNINDPEGLNRVQVRLIAFEAVSDQDAPLWARVVAPFAGQNRGTFFMPDVDDEVLVLFTNGDTRFPPVIRGGVSSRPA